MVMEPMHGKLASSQFDFGYTKQFCIPGVISVFFSSCHSVVGDFLEFHQANRGSLIYYKGKEMTTLIKDGLDIKLKDIFNLICQNMYLILFTIHRLNIYLKLFSFYD